MEGSCKPKLIVIGGPTATGKTALSVALARRFGGEIVSADSMQVYRGLDVGTAKATPAEQQGVPHHLLDILPPEVPFSVADFVLLARQRLTEIQARGHLPFVVGGTGLYVSSLVEGRRYTEQKADPALRARLEQQAAALGGAEMHRRLAQIDPEAAESIHPNNLGRVLRALELYQTTGKTMTQQKRESLPPEPPYDALCLCLGCADRETLYDRIDRRVDRMVEQGLLAEAEWVWQNRDRFRTAAQAIGYKEYFAYFAGEQSLQDCTQALKQASRRYAKRQLTWFRAMPGAVWLEAGEAAEAQALALVQRHLEG